MSSGVPLCVCVFERVVCVVSEETVECCGCGCVCACVSVCACHVSCIATACTWVCACPCCFCVFSILVTVLQNFVRFPFWWRCFRLLCMCLPLPAPGPMFHCCLCVRVCCDCAVLLVWSWSSAVPCCAVLIICPVGLVWTSLGQVLPEASFARVSDVWMILTPPLVAGGGIISVQSRPLGNLSQMTFLVFFLP